MVTFVKKNKAKQTHKQSNETKRNKWAMLPEGKGESERDGMSTHTITKETV